MLGGLQSIPEDLYEAAEVDGANWWQKFTGITLPMLRPVMMTVVLLGVIWTFNSFNIIFLVSEGGPFRSTEILATWAWRLGFGQTPNYGIAAAYSVIILLILLFFQCDLYPGIEPSGSGECAMTTHTQSYPDATPQVAWHGVKFQRQLGNIATHVILIIACIVMSFPVFWVLSTSFKPEKEVESSQITLIPQTFTLDNYDHILNKMVTTITERGQPSYEVNLFWRWAGNSLLVASITTVIGVLLAASCAYALSRFKFRGRRGVMIAFLVTQMFPGAILIVPLYNMLNEWTLLNTFQGLVIAYCTIALPFSVWMLKGFFDAIPYDLEEAAIVDGCSPFGAYWRIALPLTLPGLAVVSFFNFMTAWNEFMMALTFMSGETNKTLPVGLRNFVFQYNADWHFMAAGSVLVTIPVMIGFFYAQKYLVSGLTSGGVKG